MNLYISFLTTKDMSNANNLSTKTVVRTRDPGLNLCLRISSGWTSYLPFFRDKM